MLNHRLSTPNNAYNRSLNHHMLKDVCKKQHVCEKCFRTMYKGILCKSRKRCNTNCKHFIQEYIRCILPKGTSFDNLSQEKVELMLSNINSIKEQA